MDIKKEVISRTKVPASDYARVMKQVNDYISALQSRLDRLGIKASVVLGGSAAKGTIVRDDFDCDIFARFDSRYSDEEMPGLLEKALSGQDYARLHGSRDYFQVYNGLAYEIVPVLDITYPRDARNVTDMSPLHVEWIRKALAKKPGLADEIIIAKTFCKAQGVYGAESYISGFSGHVLDILIVYYGSFDALLKNAVQWQKYKTIDIMGHGSGLDESKISPLIVIDPVDRRRNAAAALSMEKFEAFRKAAAAYLKKPSIRFFEHSRVSDDELRSRAKSNICAIIRAKPLDGKTDVSGSKLLKIYQHLKKHIQLNDFTVTDSGWDWDKKHEARIWLIIRDEQFPGMKEHQGPPVREKEAAAQFRDKHPDAYEKEKRLYAKVKRPYQKPMDLVEDLLKSEFVASRCAGVRLC